VRVGVARVDDPLPVRRPGQRALRPFGSLHLPYLAALRRNRPYLFPLPGQVPVVAPDGDKGDGLPVRRPGDGVMVIRLVGQRLRIAGLRVRDPYLGEGVVEVALPIEAVEQFRVDADRRTAALLLALLPRLLRVGVRRLRVEEGDLRAIRRPG